MTSLNILEKWLNVSAEHENLEFKGAENTYPKANLLKYCAALANEGGGHLVLGVADRPPRKVVGTKAFPTQSSMNGIKKFVLDKLSIRVDVYELAHPQGRVLVFEIPSRTTGSPISLDGTYLMRSGESLVAMTPDRLKKIFAEDEQAWFSRIVYVTDSPDKVIALLDVQSYFVLLEIPYPTTQNAVLDRLVADDLVVQSHNRWKITNLAAILLAKDLQKFPLEIARKAPHIVVYHGSNKVEMRSDKIMSQGYASGFETLVEFVDAVAPQNRFMTEALRQEEKMFPKNSLRELLANALVHQDFEISGMSVMIEMYNDRIEISNPGKPPISVDRFIDEFRSRNVQLADIMRRYGYL